MTFGVSSARASLRRESRPMTSFVVDDEHHQAVELFSGCGGEDGVEHVDLGDGAGISVQQEAGSRSRCRPQRAEAPLCGW
jgi:hypothetical protein